MLTINYAIENRIPLDRPLTDIERKELINENKDNNYSYLCLLREMLGYKHITLGDVLNGWGGVNLVTI
jgi:hypothetical protein